VSAVRTPKQELRPFFTPKGLAEYLSISERTVREMLALRDLKAGVFRVNGTAWNGVVLESSREKNHDREGPIPPRMLARLRAMPTRIDVEWLFWTPGSAATRRPRIRLALS
jgi:hypothetical protein